MLGSEIEMSLKVVEIAFYIMIIWFVYKVVKFIVKKVFGNKIFLFFVGYFLGEFIYKRYGQRIKGSSYKMKYGVKDLAEEILKKSK